MIRCKNTLYMNMISDLKSLEKYNAYALPNFVEKNVGGKEIETGVI